MNRWYKVNKQERKETGISCFILSFLLKRMIFRLENMQNVLCGKNWNQKGRGEIASEHPAPGNEGDCLDPMDSKVVWELVP